jgi:hypothetical protein
VPLQLWSNELVYPHIIAFQAEKKLHVCIKFCAKVENNGVTTSKMLNTTFGDECLGRYHTCEWIKILKKAELQPMTIATQAIVNKQK